MIHVLTLEINHTRKKIEVHIRQLGDDHLKSMYDIIGCRCVDCVEVEIEGEYYDIWCDDESLLKENPIPTLYIDERYLILFGNLIFAKSDKHGNTCGITLEDAHRIYFYIQRQEPKLMEWLDSRK